MRLFRAIFACALSALAAGAVFAAPAHAAPTATKLTVWQAPCQNDTCTTSKDHALTSGATVARSIQIQVASTTQVGFDFVRLEARLGSGAWTCFASWTPSTNNFWAQVDWNTARWQTCAAGAGDLTTNTSVQFRLWAHEKIGNGEAITSAFAVNLNNRPSTPAWSGNPVAYADDDYPHVVLRWKANPEDDIAEYHFVRGDPDGSEQEFAVSASNPGGQGCELSGSVYECTDDAFPTRGYDGTYEYALIAYRTSPVAAQKCALPPKANCTESVTTSAHLATLNEPKHTTAGSGTSSTRPSTRPSPKVIVLGEHHTNPNQDLGALPGFEGDPYDPTLPYSETLPYSSVKPVPLSSAQTNGDDLIAAGSQTPLGDEEGNSPWRYVAGGLVLMLAGTLLTRALRAQ